VKQILAPLNFAIITVLCLSWVSCDDSDQKKVQILYITGSQSGQFGYWKNDSFSPVQFPEGIRGGTAIPMPIAVSNGNVYTTAVSVYWKNESPTLLEKIDDAD
jgi:hypothetical protein